jgi:hypothetical protein
MEIKSIVLGIVVLAAVVIVATVTSLLARKSGGFTGKYKQRKLMTDNELEFFRRLVKALPEHFIFPQVAMSALLESSNKDPKQVRADRLRIAQQRTDFVICNATCGIVAVVELDDKTHSKAKDDVRDSRLDQAGIRTVRFQSRNKPSIEEIRSSLFPESKGHVSGAIAAGVVKTVAPISNLHSK